MQLLHGRVRRLFSMTQKARSSRVKHHVLLGIELALRLALQEPDELLNALLQ